VTEAMIHKNVLFQILRKTVSRLAGHSPPEISESKSEMTVGQNRSWEREYRKEKKHKQKRQQKIQLKNWSRMKSVSKTLPVSTALKLDRTWQFATSMCRLVG
jgi:hypothetical protein